MRVSHFFRDLKIAQLGDSNPHLQFSSICKLREERAQHTSFYGIFIEAHWLGFLFSSNFHFHTVVSGMLATNLVGNARMSRKNDNVDGAISIRTPQKSLPFNNFSRCSFHYAQWKQKKKVQMWNFPLTDHFISFLPLSLCSTHGQGVSVTSKFKETDQMPRNEVNYEWAMTAYHQRSRSQLWNPARISPPQTLRTEPRRVVITWTPPCGT